VYKYVLNTVVKISTMLSISNNTPLYLGGGAFFVDTRCTHEHTHTQDVNKTTRQPDSTHMTTIIQHNLDWHAQRNTIAFNCERYASKSYNFFSLQVGQHPLTGQRATNFRLLANQWAERRLVTQCVTATAPWGEVCATQVLPLRVGLFTFRYQGTELLPVNILIPLERQLIAL